MRLASWLAQRRAETTIAIEWPGGAWRFADWERAARAEAQSLAPQAGVVAILAGGIEFAIAFLGVLLAGGTALPLNQRLTLAELLPQLRRAGARHLWIEAGDPRAAELQAALPELRVRVIGSASAAPSLDAPVPRVAETLVLLYTSGTSGAPKAVRLGEAQFAASAEATLARLGDAALGRWLACMPLFHIGGLSILMRGLILGAPIRLLPRFEVEAVAAELARGDIAALSLVPTMLQRLLATRRGQRAPAGLRVLLLGGAAAAPALIADALAQGYPVCPTYGLTEACSQVATSAPPAGNPWRATPLRALPGLSLRIVHAGAPQPPGTVGEIEVAGPTVMQGYLDDPEANARALRAGWLATGDLGWIDAEGGLHVLDRREDLIVSGGENVYPAEVEAVLLLHPDVLEAGVCAAADADLGQRVEAHVVLRQGAHWDPARLTQHCRQHLAGYKLPRRWHQHPALPRNAAGKLLRRELSG